MERGGREMIAVGCDHGGYDLKQIIVSHLKEKGILEIGRAHV